MKIIKKGNIYKKASWFKENEERLWTLACGIVSFLCLAIAILIRSKF